MKTVRGVSGSVPARPVGRAFWHNILACLLIAFICTPQARAISTNIADWVVGGKGWRIVAITGELQPATNGTMKFGDSTHQVGNATIVNLAAGNITGPVVNTTGNATCGNLSAANNASVGNNLSVPNATIALATAANVSSSNVSTTNLTSTTLATLANATVSNTITFSGPIKTAPTTITGNVTLTVSNTSLLFIAGINNNTTITLPSATTVGAGAKIDWADTTGNVTVNGNVTFAATAGNVIGAGNVINNTTYQQGSLRSNGTNWYAAKYSYQ